MKSITTFSTSIAALATLAATNPLPLGSDAKRALLTRADIVEVTCPAVNNAGEVKYSVREIEDAFNIGSGLLRPPPHWVTGANGKDYPAFYGNYNNIPLPADCTTADLLGWQEFPILRTKVAFGDASQPGPDRVIFARKNDGSFTYCYTVYHKDDGSFSQCT